MDNIEEKKQAKYERKQQLAKQEKEDVETPAQRRRREREERKANQQLARMQKKEADPIESQIKINFGGRIVDSSEERNGLKKYDHSNDDIEPLTKETKGK